VVKFIGCKFISDAGKFMITAAAINMTSYFMMLILERTAMIGGRLKLWGPKLEYSKRYFYLMPFTHRALGYYYVHAWSQIWLFQQQTHF